MLLLNYCCLWLVSLLGYHFAEAKPATIQIRVTPKSTPQKAPTPYATISLDLSKEASGTVTSFSTPNSAIVSEPLVEIGIFDSKSASIENSIAVRGAELDPTRPKIIVVHLSASREVLGISLRHDTVSSTHKKASKGDWPEVRVESPSEGPSPELEKPVQLNEDGQVPELEVQKSFFQKYWWLFLGAVVFVLASGGDK